MIVSTALVAASTNTTDLRRRRTRAQAQQLTRRAKLLDPPDRRLIEDMFDAGRPCSTIAAELGTDPRALRRRARRITTRMLDPRFDFVAAQAESWRPTRRRVANWHYIKGKSLRVIARELGMSLYSVRRHRDAVEAMFELAQETGRAAPNQRDRRGD
ncbi:MAG: hypothetical protein AAGH71_01915 [Planctomycetota bacterium]